MTRKTIILKNSKLLLFTRLILVAISLFFTTNNSFSQTPNIWINEIHWKPVDANIGVEIAGDAGFNLSCYEVQLYKASSGSVVPVLAKTVTFIDSIIPNENGGGYGAVWKSHGGLTADHHTAALLYKTNGGTCPNPTTLIQVLGFGTKLAASNGDAIGVIPTEILESNGSNIISEGSTANDPGNAIQLTGTGTKYSDFTWVKKLPASKRKINVLQDASLTGDKFNQDCFKVNWIVNKSCYGGLSDYKGELFQVTVGNSDINVGDLTLFEMSGSDSWGITTVPNIVNSINTSNGNSFAIDPSPSLIIPAGAKVFILGNKNFDYSGYNWSSITNPTYIVSVNNSNTIPPLFNNTKPSSDYYFKMLNSATNCYINFKYDAPTSSGTNGADWLIYDNNGVQTVDKSKGCEIPCLTPILSIPDAPLICAGQSFDLSTIAITDQSKTSFIRTYKNAAGAPLSSSIVSPSSTTTYKIVGSSGLCSSELIVTVTVNPIPTITGTTTASICGTGEVTLGADASAGTINWYDALTGGALVGTGTSFTTPTITTTTPYYVDATENGCTSSPRTAIIAIINPTVEASVSITSSDADNIICAGEDVTFTAIPVNGGTPTYQWKNGTTNVGTNSTTFATTSLASGNSISVVMTSTAACANGTPATSNSIITTVNPSLTASVIISSSDADNTICIGESVTFTATPDNGGTTPSYQWKIGGVNVGGENGSSYTTTSLTNNNSVTVEMTSNADCPTGSPATSNPIVITVNPILPVSVTINSSDADNTICPGESITFTAIPVNGGTPSYQWKLNGGNIGTNSVTYITSALSNNDNVEVEMTSNISSCISGSPTNSIPIIITVTDLPTASISYAGTPFCKTLTNEQAVTFTGTTGGAYTSTANLTINQNTGGIIPSSSSAGTYTVTYTIPANGGCPEVTATTPITISAVVSGSISYTGSPYCTSVTSEQSANFSGTTGGTYSSSSPDLTLNTSSGKVTPSTSLPGSYTVNYFVSGSGGCADVNATATVIITEKPTASVSYSSSSFCNTESTQSVLSPNSGGTYSAAPTGLSIDANSGDIIPSISTPNTYTITYTIPTSNGCTEVIATTNVTITAQPTASISYASPQFCSGLTGTQNVTLVGTAGGTFSSSPAGLSINPSSGAITSSSSAAGDYTVTYDIPTSGGCTSATTNALVKIFTTPSISLFDFSNPGACGEASGALIISGTMAGTVDLSWTGTTPGNKTITSLPQPIPDLKAGSYDVSINNNSCKSNTLSKTLNDPNAPSPPTITIIGSTTLCSNESVTLESSATTGNVWSPNNETSQSISVNTGGSYSVTVTSNGCSATSNSVSITVTPTPSTPIVGIITQPTCAVATGSVALSGLPTGAWTINPGGITGSGTTTTLTGLAASTTYNYTVTSASCTSLASDDVTTNIQPATPSSPAIGGITQPTCSIATGDVDLSDLPSTGTWIVTESIGLTTITGTGTTATFTSLEANKTHTFKVTDATGCVSPASANAVINAPSSAPSIPVIGVITQPTCVVATGAVTLSDLPSTGTWIVTESIGLTTITGTGTTATFPDLPENKSYTFKVEDAAGCVSPASANAVIIAQPTIPLTPTIGTITQPTCSNIIGNVALSGLPAGAWTINPGAIAGSGVSTNLSNLAASTTYNFTVTSEGCTSIASNDVIILSAPSAPSISIDGTTNPTACGTLTGTITIGGSETGNLSWTGVTIGSENSITLPHTVSGLGSGLYDFTFDVSGCTSFISSSINDPGAPATPTITVTNGSTTFCDGGDVTLTSSPVIGDLYLWSPGNATSQSISPTASGNYSVKITDASGCSSSSLPTNVTVNPIPATPTITVTDSPTFCDGGSVILTSSSITGNSWSSGETNQSITKSVSGNYFVTVTSNNCPSAPSTSVLVTANPIPTLIITDPDPVLQPATVDLTDPLITAGSTTGTDLTYWNDATANVSQISNPFAISTSNSYYIKSTLGICSSIEKVVVTVNTASNLNIVDPKPVCSPNTVDITTPAITAGSTNIGTLTYWEDATGTTTEITNPNTISIGKTYYIKSSLGDIKPVNVTINPTPTVVITDPPAVCSPSAVDLAATSITLGTTPSTTFTYWKNSAGTSTLTNQSSISISGKYYIKGTIGNCSDLVKEVNVTINSTPTVLVSNPKSVCSPDEIDLSISSITAGSTPGLSYTYWEDLAQTKELANEKAISSSGTYYIKGTSGSCFDIKPVEVIILSPSSPTITAQGQTVLCAGGNVTLSSTPANKYLWSNGKITKDIEATTSSDYYTWNDDNGCLVKSNTIQVIVNPLPLATTGSDSTICEGSSKQLGSTAINGNTYSWVSNPVGFTSTSANPPANPSETTTYTLTETTTLTNCFKQNSVTVTVNPAPVAAGSITKDILCFDDFDGEIIATVTKGAPPFAYVWTDATGGTVTDSDNIDSLLSDLTTGTYYVSINDAKGCSSLIPKSFSFSAPSKIFFTLDRTDVNCYGKSNGSAFATENPSGGTGKLKYQWYDVINENQIEKINDTLLTIPNQPVGQYKLKVTDANDCSITNTKFINQPAPLKNTFVTQDILCNGDYTGKITANVTGGKAVGYSLVWLNPEIGKEQYSSFPNASITALKANKDYTLKIIDISDVTGECFIMDKARLSEPPKLTVSTVKTNNICYGYKNGQIQVIAKGGVPNYEFWINDKINNPNKNDSLFTNLSAGTYIIKVIDSYNCSTIVKDSLVNPPLDPIAKFTYSPEEVTHLNLTANFINNSVGATQNSWTFDNLGTSSLPNPSFTFPDTGQYKITLNVANDKGCTSADSILLKVVEATQLFIPSSFSPDGDGLNDTFKPEFYGDQIQSYKLSIFNKWGEQLFFTDNQALEWNGVNRQLSATVPNGTYIYILEIETITGKSINKTGTFTIVR